MSTKKESMSGSSSSLWFIVAVLALIALIGMSATFFSSMHKSNEQQTEITNYKKHHGYVTMNQAKQAFNTAISIDSDDLMNKLDNMTVVDNSNGHEYTAQISGGGFSHYHIHFMPLTNGSTATINAAWNYHDIEREPFWNNPYAQGNN